jgi:hypothetical protein
MHIWDTWREVLQHMIRCDDEVPLTERVVWERRHLEGYEYDSLLHDGPLKMNTELLGLCLIW